MCAKSNKFDTEFFIPLPTGQLAAKSWGNENGNPILLLHGWLDNIGTFDRLIPLLPSHYYFVGFDFLGHGLSSHKPIGEFYELMDMLLQIKRVVTFLKWDKFSIIGHSMGAIIGLFYGSLFPDCVECIISLDIIKPETKKPHELAKETRATMIGRLQIEDKLKKNPREYTFDAAKNYLKKEIIDQVIEDGASVLMKRGTKFVGENTVVFTRDIRLHKLFGFRPLSHEELKSYLTKLTSHLLIICAKQSKLYTSPISENNREIISIYETKCKSFTLVEVDGNHFVHLNNPETIVPYIESFLKEKISKFTFSYLKKTILNYL